MLLLAREGMKSKSDICRSLSNRLCSHLSQPKFGGQAGTCSGVSTPAQANTLGRCRENTPELGSVRTGDVKTQGEISFSVVLHWEKKHTPYTNVKLV